ncbi:Bug family tripartite tricarboxylate transporter substrate binding protein [Pseudorhodoferax soli]|uniref:Tripartite-type tricarboxylate transporter receptor subunit TctC n=1 Tax=Pseudorhodoferax soli TaxID=545864 RepID=A0A368XCA4_9BURK|nr:tripartite tricarboxylate transporter substrate binding protein [Pseudorhodoferax soli]RCW65592.1 tripartite-type tricarboxylate transporter receptor subunit TctC [Pseudorhodoferax soli]
MTHFPGAPARRHLLLALACSAGLVGAIPALAQDYPTKPVELVVSAAAGGGTDAVARTFGEAARTHFAQPIVVVNKPGAASSIGFTDVALSRKDGYKMGVISVNLAILPALNLTKVVVEDYTFIARLNNDPSAITVAADAPWKSIEEFLAAAKQAPEKIRVGNAGTGDAWHVAALALEEKTGTRFTHIPYQGGNPAVLSLLGGHLDAVTVSPGEVAQHVAAGKLRVLAVMADARMPGLFAGTPTLKERGIDLTVGAWRGLAVPKGTPDEVVAKLRTMARQAAAEPAFRETLERSNLGYSYAEGDVFLQQILADREMFKGILAKIDVKK